MTIKEIELYNFRIYKGENIIKLSTDGKKNIFVGRKPGFSGAVLRYLQLWRARLFRCP